MANRGRNPGERKGHLDPKGQVEGLQGGKRLGQEGRVTGCPELCGHPIRTGPELEPDRGPEVGRMTTGKTELLGWNCETPVQGRLLDWQPCLADKAGKADCHAEFVGIHASQRIGVHLGVYTNSSMLGMSNC